MAETTAPVVPASPAPVTAPVPPAQSAVPNAANPSAENLNSEQVKVRLAASDRARLAAPAEQTSPAPAEAPTPAESTAPETPVTPETQAEGEEPADVLSNLASLDPKTRQLVEAEWEKRKLYNQDKIDKRIGKVTAEKMAAQQAALSAQQELNALRAQQVQSQPTGPLPLEQIQDMNGLGRLHQEARQTIRDVERLLARDDIANGVQIGEKVWTKADLVEAKFNAQSALEDQIPARARFIQQREQATQAAIEKFPFLKDPASPEYAEAQAMFQNPEYAWLRNAPNAVEIVGTYLVGKKHLTAAHVATVKPTQNPPSSQTATSSMGLAARVAPEQRANTQVTAALETLKKKGSVNSSDVRAYLKQLDLAKQR